MRFIPETAKRDDWPRLVKQGVNALIRAVAGLTERTDWAALADYADDTAAAAGGVPVGSLYRTGSVVKVRVA